MGKLGDILNKDVGSIATKVFKADVGEIVKSAGRALNTDVGTIAKGAGNVLSYDLSDLFSSGVENTDAQGSGGGAPAQNQTENIQRHSTHAAAANAAAVSTQPVAASVPSADASPATINPPARARLTEALVARNSRVMPAGLDLNSLLPVKVGAFSRLPGAAQGEIASDPVSATYSSNVEAITVTLAACWDADEARDKLKRRQSKLESARGTPDHSWAAGIDSHGVVFVWTREHFCYEIVSPRGVSALAGFLADFPY